MIIKTKMSMNKSNIHWLTSTVLCFRTIHGCLWCSQFAYLRRFFFLLKYKHYLQSENGIANVSDQVKFIWSLSVFVPLTHTAHWVHKATSRRLFEVVLSIKTRISWENQSDPIFTEEALRDLCSVMLLKTSRN